MKLFARIRDWFRPKPKFVLYPEFAKELEEEFKRTAEMRVKLKAEKESKPWSEPQS